MIGPVTSGQALRERLTELRDLLRHGEYAKADEFAEELEREVGLRLEDDDRQSRRWPW